jgi:hypothetical protein
VKLIRPVTITDSMLTSDVPETGDAAWSSGTTYPLGDRGAVLTGTVNTVYSSIRNGNMLLWSEDFTNAAWVKSSGATVTSNTTLAPDGATTADTLNDTSAVAESLVYQNLTVPNDAQAYVGSIYVKKTTGATNSIVVTFAIYGGTTAGRDVYLNTDTGAYSTSGPSPENVSVVDAGSYWRVITKIANNTSGNTTLQLGVYPAFADIATPTTLANSRTGSTIVWGAQIEKGTTVTSYTATTTAAIANLNNAPASSPTWWRKVADSYTAYSSGTTYALNAIVTDTTKHRLMQSIQASNTGHALSDPAWWLDIGPSNRWAMFDQAVGTESVETGTIKVALTPGSVDSLVLVDTTAETATVTMTVSGSTVYASTQSTNVGGSAITDWFLYFFEPIGTKTVLTFLDLPVYPSASIAIELDGADPAGPVAIGSLIVGRKLEIGSTEVGASVGIIDYSKKNTDDFGVTTVVERSWAKRMQLRCLLDTANVDGIQRELAKVRATPCIWIGEDGYDSLTIYGYYKEFSLDLAFPNISYCSLTIEGLT